MRGVSRSQSRLPARREARFVAWAIDALVVALTLPVFLGLGGLTVLLQTDWLALDPNGMQWVGGYVVALLWLSVPLWYFGLASARGGTVGARVMGLRVVDPGGRQVTTGQALWRALLMYPSLALLGAGGLMSLRSGGLTAHDQWSGTLVVEIVDTT